MVVKILRCVLCCALMVMQLPLLAAPSPSPSSLPVPVVAPVRSITLQPGPLRAQLTAIVQEWGWQQVVWQLPHDYQWYGHVQFQSNTLPALLNKLLAPYPIQAVLYQGNHVLVFVPRRVA
jgi:hypothetical protein